MVLKRARLVRRRFRARLEDFFDGGPVRRLLYSVGMAMFSHDVPQAASAMAFDLFLASLPSLALLGWVVATVLTQDDARLYNTSVLLGVTPEQLGVAVDTNIGRFTAGAAPVVLAGALWIASSALARVMSVLEVSTRAQRRPWWMKRLIAMGCMATLFLAGALNVAVTVRLGGGVSAWLERVERVTVVPWVSLYAQAGLALVTGFFLLAGFFRIAVHKPDASRRYVFPGAVLALVMAVSASYGFAVYARTLARYSVFYGSLAGSAVGLIWLWILCFSILAGAELNAQLENESMRRLPGRRKQLPIHIAAQLGLDGDPLTSADLQRPSMEVLISHGNHGTATSSGDRDDDDGSG